MTEKNNLKKCPECEKNFKVKPSHFLRRKYCSKDCMAKGYKMQLKGEANPNYKNSGWQSCEMCNIKFHSYFSNRRFCSQKCSSDFNKTITGENNPNWKGENITYETLHAWLYRKWGKPEQCDFCGASDKRIEWANKTGKYTRERKDWLNLCCNCHKNYDKNIKNHKYKGKIK